MQNADDAVEESCRNAFQRVDSPPSPEVAVLLAQVDRLRTVPGVAVSTRFDTIRDGIRTLATLEGTLPADTFDTLTEVTCRNDTGAMAVAYTAALAALSDARHTASSTVQHALLGELRSEYAGAADRNHAAVADAFDHLAAALVAAAGVVDLRMAAVEVLHASDDERAAWLDAEQLARALDEHAVLLVAAAGAAGKRLTHESHRPDTETEQWLQLTVDLGAHDGGRAWQVWDAPAENAAGRWGGMLLAGFTLRATPLADLRPYGRPLRVEPGEARPQQHDVDENDGDGPATRPPRADPAIEVRRISWPRALALLGLGCLALAVAAGFGVLAAGFYVAAVIEPHDVLLAAREALCGSLLLGAGVSCGLAWAVLAAVGCETGAGAVVPARRKAPLRGRERALEVVPG